MSLKRIIAPTAEPIALADAKAHLRVDGTDEDALITALIVAAREAAEQATGRSLMPQTWELALDRFPGAPTCARYGSPVDRWLGTEIVLPRPPLVSVSAVRYVDSAGTTQDLASSAWLLDDFSEPARIVPAFGAEWPQTREQPNAVTVTYEAGYADADSVPQGIRQWMLVQIGAMYAHREAVAAVPNIVEIPFADRLLDPYRLWAV